MNAQKSFSIWHRSAIDDPDLVNELSVLDSASDAKAIKERFSYDMEFGTGGLRGIIGAGTSRMNIYTVRRATQGLCDYLKAQEKPESAVIAYDSRHKSRLFAEEAAGVLAANGIHAYIFPRIMPTPCLSFAVRRLSCSAGICVTASHNPAEYNGYKVYGPDGGQITEEAAKAIYLCIQNTDPFNGTKLISFDAALLNGSVSYTEESLVDTYLDAVWQQSTRPDMSGAPLKAVYTPLNGTGLECVAKILKRAGFSNVIPVEEQSRPDGDFPTCPSPNPEDPAALEFGLSLCKESSADILLATDPDCDRLGVAVRDGEDYVRLNGNEIGVLLLDYLCRKRLENGDMPKRPIAVKTIVTTDMARRISEKYGVEMRETLTGFKYIGELIGKLEKNDEENRFLFGFEESCGFLSGTYARDKDGVVAAMLVCEMAQDYKSRGMTLFGAVEALYGEYGCHQSALYSYTFAGQDGVFRRKAIMTELRQSPINQIAGTGVSARVDYLLRIQNQDLPLSDVLKYELSDGSKLFIRPSGTEPKIKVYIFTDGESRAEANSRIHQLNEALSEYINNI